MAIVNTRSVEARGRVHANQGAVFNARLCWVNSYRTPVLPSMAQLGTDNAFFLMFKSLCCNNGSKSFHVSEQWYEFACQDLPCVFNICAVAESLTSVQACMHKRS